MWCCLYLSDIGRGAGKVGAIKLKLYAAIGGLVAILMGVFYAMGRKDNAAKEDREDANEYRETTERISEARPIDDNADNARDRLRDRNKR